MIPKDSGFAPGVNLLDTRNLLAKPDQLKRLFNRIQPYFSITGATTDAPPIVITTAVKHFLTNGDQVTITRVKGNTAANGVFPVVVLSPTTFSLTGSMGNGAYVANTGSVVLGQKGQTIDQPKGIGSLNELITFLRSRRSSCRP